ncbi:hypothetical protein BDP27DRAFT_1417986 [Rhodocollybia butyracea]|uniref:Alkyl hydroperoxide reductase subunit C/ Thiol specific antioxidant domain-containing protein n=1 Tax=Rhodocollybia butyracea TaxID=206335 RepID=A0A9P5Q078_9AGAR|nr:hypothetical protein BDP27DRAFT_1417986 [Rhodocollybia butyracea]
MSRVQPTLETGSIAPSFEGPVASGSLKFPQWSGEAWSIVFSHPSSFTLELKALVQRLPDIEQRNIKVIGLSRNWLDEDRYWNKALQDYDSQSKNVEIVEDEQGQISSLYGMFSGYDSNGVVTIANTMFLVDPSNVIRLVMAYPSSLSTGFDEIFRFVDGNSGILQDIPTEIFGLDVKGQGQIYNGDVVVSSNGSAATVDIVKSAAAVISNVRSDSSSGGNSSSNTVVSEATDYVQHAINVMDSLADLGKVMPFVAPAFVIIKAIIAVEQRARDVDTKCTDLVQRVTFMLSHLPALKMINVTDSTRQVIDRMNDTLKKSAALIQTYRKQSAVARRLSVHNKDRFASCALLVTQCTSDLMISLQIHQSIQLDILTRPVPSDPEDEAAASFVAAHGGIDAIRVDEGLVKQFASEMKLSVDDKVMEQLNANISEVLQQNQDRLEQTLNETVTTSVIDGIKGLAARMNEAAKEQTFVCVQCNKDYHDSTNGEKSCSFHRDDEYDSWYYRCCGTPNPCQAGRHRPEHHCDYPYGNFFPFAYGIINYINTMEEWASLEDLNYETNKKVTVSIARLLRWNAGGAVLEVPTILIRVGQLSFNEPFLFKTFNATDLAAISRVVGTTHQTLIFRSSPSKDEFSMAEWVLSAEGMITGVTITAKASTSAHSHIQYCPIDISSCTKSGEVRPLSEGSFRASKPSAPYILPEVQCVSGTVPEGNPRATRTFKARTTPKFPVMVKPISHPPLVANPEFANNASDYFTGSISVFNKHASMESVSIASATAFYRFVGDEEYKPVKSVEVLDGVVLPYSIDPRQTWTLKFGVTVQRNSKDAKVEDKWWDRAFIARQRPLRIKLVLTDIEDEECSLVIDYVCPARKQLSASSNDTAFFYVADPFTWRRYCVHVANDSNLGQKVVEISSECSNGDRVSTRMPHQFDAERMKKIVYKALQSGDSEVDLDIGKDIDIGKSTAWSWKAWALIDLSCQRIYAFKILIKKHNEGAQDYACLGYVPCPEYGDFYNETRPIRYATEMVKFPELDPYVATPVILDDEFDDFVPEVQKVPDTVQSDSSTQAVVLDEINKRTESTDGDIVPEAQKLPIIVQTGSSAQLAVLEKINKHLESLDNNLSLLAKAQEQHNSPSGYSARIAKALEQLVQISRTKK